MLEKTDKDDFFDHIKKTQFFVDQTQLHEDDNTKYLLCLIIDSLNNSSKDNLKLSIVFQFTQKFFPRIISLNNKEALLIWDLNFWNSFAQYYDLLVNLKYVNEENSSKYRNDYFLIIASFLNNIFNTKGSIYTDYFAKKIKDFIKKLTEPLEKNSTLTGFSHLMWYDKQVENENAPEYEIYSDLLIFSKIYILSHEITHLY